MNSTSKSAFQHFMSIGELADGVEVLRLSVCHPEVQKFLASRVAEGEFPFYLMRGELVMRWEDVGPYAASGSEPSIWEELDD